MDGNTISAIRNELKEHVNEATKNSTRSFFKEEVKFLGVKTSIVRKIAKKYFEDIKYKNKKEVFSLCEQLLQTDYGEEAYIAFEWAYWMHNEYEPTDFKVFETWLIKYVNNWAKCDTLCNHTIGSFVEQFPQYTENLKAWTKSNNRWLRRASAVTLILPARKGKFLDDIFEIADSLLKDKEDLVQKGYGWMLKETSRKHRKEVFEYVMKNKNEMPRTALRYAIEKMPEDLKRLGMEKKEEKKSCCTPGE